MALTKFVGLQYPLVKSPRGLMAQKRGIDQIKADILQLLLTHPGERVMIPEFGTPLRELVFDPNDATLALRAKQMIATAIERWEPRIEIANISASTRIPAEDLHFNDTGDESEAILHIKIDFLDPENIAQVESLVIERPLGG